ncbi:MBL fold metallo-hydrolase [Egbenema bharatensis]|uniref:MBL fold metallo-hydrolase n=1 Tax=Egbenema bharatensis TaxID=3463334 RepID=UPI003A8C2918
MHLTWLDNNAWLIEMGGQRILLDPWLVGALVFGNMPWLVKGVSLQPRSIPENIDLILLSQGLEDHAHPETLQQLDRQIPVVASSNAAKVVEKLGFRHITPLPHGAEQTIADRLTIQAVPGAVVGPFLTENGYLITDRSENIRLYYEPHGFHSETLQNLGPVDVVIAPIVASKLPVVGAIVQGAESALRAVELLQPRFILPTANGSQVKFEGLIGPLITEEGSVEEFRRLLVQKQYATQVIAPNPGERFEVERSAIDR